MPAFANTMAMPPPIVPAPTTAALFTGNDRCVLRHIGNLGDFALAEENVNESLGLIRLQAFEEQLLLSLAALIER